MMFTIGVKLSNSYDSIFIGLSFKICYTRITVNHFNILNFTKYNYGVSSKYTDEFMNRIKSMLNV